MGIVRGGASGWQWLWGRLCLQEGKQRVSRGLKMAK